MARARLTRVAWLSAGHFVAAMACLLFSVGAALAAFDHPGHDGSPVVLIGGLLAAVLMLPGMIVWEAMRGWAPEPIEWVVVVLNSVCWGVAVAALLEFRSRLAARPRV